MSAPVSESVPQDTAARESRYASLSKQLPESFSGHIRRRNSSAWYQAAMFATALMVVLLPLVYVGLTLLVAWGVLMYALHVWPALGGLNLFFRFLAYLVPLISGAVLVLFMLKPLIAPRAVTHSKVRLRERDEPVLFEFIRKVSKEVGAPLPKRVDVDVQVNASASFRRGWFSLFSDDLVLTIGLPLVASLSIRQFGGVLAHEFGHFSQSLGMRLTFVIRSINAWFHRVVFQRDRWDVWMDELRHNETLFVNIIFNVSALGVWCSRKVLHGLMVVSHAVSCYTLRQMEYDADYYEMHMSGSENFGTTCQQLNCLNLASGRSYVELELSWNQRRLVDNLADYIHHRGQQLPQGVIERVREAVREAKTGIFDTHPTDRSRIARAEKVNAQGILHIQGEARELFRNFGELARQVTRHHYTIDMGLPIEPQHLVPEAEMAELGSRNQRAEETARVFFGYTPRNSLPLYSPDWVWRAPEYLAEGVEELLDLRAKARKAALKMNGLWPEHDTIYQRRTAICEARALLEAGFKLQPGVLGLKELNLSTLQKELDSVNEKLAVIREEMTRVQSCVGDRLAAALRCLWSPEVQEGIENGPELARRTDVNLKCMRALRDTLGPVDDLFLLMKRAIVVHENLAAAPEHSRAVAQLKNQAPVLIQRLNVCLSGLPDDLMYPFEHSTGEISCKAYLQAHDVKQTEDYGELSLIVFSLLRIREFFDRIFDLQVRLRGELILAAVQVEEVTLPDEEPFDADLAGAGNIVIRELDPSGGASSILVPVPVSTSPTPPLPEPVPIPVPAKQPAAAAAKSAPAVAGSAPRAGAIMPSSSVVAARRARGPEETEADAAGKPSPVQEDLQPAPASTPGAKVPLKSTQRMPSFEELGLAAPHKAAENGKATETKTTVLSQDQPAAEPTPSPGLTAIDADSDASTADSAKPAPILPAGQRPPAPGTSARGTKRIPITSLQRPKPGNLGPMGNVGAFSQNLGLAKITNLVDSAKTVSNGHATPAPPEAAPTPVPPGEPASISASAPAPAPAPAPVPAQVQTPAAPVQLPPAAAAKPLAPTPAAPYAPAGEDFGGVPQRPAGAPRGISIQVKKETNKLPAMIMAPPKLQARSTKTLPAQLPPVRRQATPEPSAHPAQSAPSPSPASAIAGAPPVATPAQPQPAAPVPPPIPQAAPEAAPQPQIQPVTQTDPTLPPPIPQFAETSTPAPAAAPKPEPRTSETITPPPLPFQPAPMEKPVVRRTLLPPMPGEAPVAASAAEPPPLPIPEPAPAPAPPSYTEESVSPTRTTQPRYDYSGNEVTSPAQKIVAPAARQLIDRDPVPEGERPTIGARSTRVFPSLSQLMASPSATGEESGSGSGIAQSPETGSPARRPLLNPEDRPAPGIMGPRSTRVIPALADLKPGSGEKEPGPLDGPVTPIVLAGSGDPSSPIARATSLLGPRAVPMDRNLRDDASVNAPEEGRETARIQLPAAAQHLKPIRTEESVQIPLKRSGITQRVELPEPPQPRAVKPIREPEERPTAVRGLKDSGPIIVPETKSLASAINRPAPVPPPMPVAQRLAQKKRTQKSVVTPTTEARPKPGAIRPGPIQRQSD